MSVRSVSVSSVSSDGSVGRSVGQDVTSSVRPDGSVQGYGRLVVGCCRLVSVVGTVYGTVRLRLSVRSVVGCTVRLSVVGTGCRVGVVSNTVVGSNTIRQIKSSASIRTANTAVVVKFVFTVMSRQLQGGQSRGVGQASVSMARATGSGASTGGALTMVRQVDDRVTASRRRPVSSVSGVGRHVSVRSGAVQSVQLDVSTEV